FRMQYRLLAHAGQFRWVEYSGSPWYEGTGEFGGFLGAAIDIDDRKHGIFTPDEHSVRLIYSLTERERQVLVLIANGKSTKQAALELGISYKTADSHRSRILEKLGVHETASMVRYAIRAGLVVFILEARHRIGGRIHTLHDSLSPVPIELGAEFIHGTPPAIWNHVE